MKWTNSATGRTIEIYNEDCMPALEKMKENEFVSRLGNKMKEYKNNKTKLKYRERPYCHRIIPFDYDANEHKRLCKEWTKNMNRGKK